MVARGKIVILFLDLTDQVKLLYQENGDSHHFPTIFL